MPLNPATALRNAFIAHGPRVLGRSGFAFVARKLGRVPGLDVEQTRAQQLARHPGARTLDDDAFRRSVYAAYYGEASANEIVPGDSVRSARSFVPYYRGTTCVLLFNFFRANYNIRDPMLYRYSIFDGPRAVYSEQVVLAGNGVRWLPDPALTDPQLPAHGTLVIEAFNPRVSTSAEQLRFLVLYRDEAAGTISGTHSFPLPSGHLPALGQPSHRGFGTADAPFFYHSALANRVPLSPRDEGRTLRRLGSGTPIPGFGFVVCESQTGAPTTIWHDGPTSHALDASASGKTAGEPYTAFFVPDFALHAPFLLISRSQVGFLPRRVRISVAADGESWSQQRDVEINEDNTTIDMRAEFPALKGPVNCVLEFDRDVGEFAKMPSCMVHVYHRSPGGLGDQGHSHTTLGFNDDPFRRLRSYRCRKFAPYVKDPGLEFVYSIVHLRLGRRPGSDQTVRVRVYTDKGSERVVILPLSPTGMTTIRPDEVLQTELADIEHAAVVQFEHDTTNFNGSWYAIDRRTGHVGTDHFTGG